MTKPVIKMVAMAGLIPDPGQLARHSAEKVNRLAADMAANGLLQPIGVLEDGRFIFGHGRYAGAKLNGWKEIESKVYPATLTETQVKVVRLSENIHRSDLREPDVYLAVKELMRLNPSWQRKDLAEKLSLQPPMVTKILSVDGLIPAAREAFLAGAFGFTKAYEISQGDEAQQHEMLSLTLGNGKATREDLRQARRKTNRSDSVKVKRIKIETSLGITVTFSANELSLDDAIQAAPEAAKIMEKGRKDGLTAKTIQQMSAEKAKGG